MRYRLEWLVVKTLSLKAAVLPRRLCLALGRLFGLLFYYLCPKLRRIALSNLDIAFPSTSGSADKPRIARRSFSHFGSVIMDILWGWRHEREAIQKLVEYEGLENLERAYGKGRGVLLFTGHFGHWELMGVAQGYLGFPLRVVSRPLDNPYLEKILHSYRCKSGNKVIHKRDAVKGILGALRKEEGVAVLIDQNAIPQEGIFIRFFGRWASTTPILASLALRTKAPLIPAFALPIKNGRYRLIYEKEIEPGEFADRREAIVNLTQRCTDVIEGYIRRYPQYWLWIHQRWKSQPPQEG